MPEVTKTSVGYEDEDDENKQDFKLLVRRGTSSAPLAAAATSDQESNLNRAGTNDMIWPLHLTPTFVGHYIIGDVIGNGSYAEVRECVDTRTLERCALKIVNRSYLTRQAPRALANQLQEIRLLKRLEHPNLISMKECLFRGDRIYIVLEHCPYNLDDLLNDQRDGMLHVSLARSFFLQLCSAVAHLHALGIVHRDIKPQNMLLTNEGGLKLIDLGVAHLLSMWDERGLCSSHEGSPLFQAPEVVSGHKEYCGFKVDVWSCGITLYLMLYGQYPFNDEALLGLYDKILAEDLVVPPSAQANGEKKRQMLPDCPALVDLIASMLDKVSLRRASIEEVLEHPWCRLPLAACYDSEFDLNSEFFDLVTCRHNDSEKHANIYATSQLKDMYKSMTCLPYLYRHHFPSLPIRKPGTRRESSTGSSAIVERINLMSPGVSPSSSKSSSRASSPSPSLAQSSSYASSPSESSTISYPETEDEESPRVEWGTRAQYQLMKVPQVRANRIRTRGRRAASRKRLKHRRNRENEGPGPTG